MDGLSPACVADSLEGEFATAHSIYIILLLYREMNMSQYCWSPSCSRVLVAKASMILVASYVEPYLISHRHPLLNQFSFPATKLKFSEFL